MIYLRLFSIFFKVGLFGFGGGYAMLSLIQNEIVEQNQWITTQEFADMVAISQMTPGPISINLATYVGFTIGGIFGAVVCTLSLCLPAIILMFIIIRILHKYKDNFYVSSVLRWLKPAVAGLIFTSALLLMNAFNFCDFGLGKDNISLLICAFCFVAIYFFKANPIVMILCSGAVGWLVYF